MEYQADNPIRYDIVEYLDKTDGERVGSRIRRIRLQQEMTQIQLGKMVGLTPDRVQKYESGVRKPKSDLLIKIATALKVSPLALLDPVVTGNAESMFVLFELERLCGAKPVQRGGTVSLDFEPSSSINNYMLEWCRKYDTINAELNVAKTDDEKEEIKQDYDEWKMTFPKAIVDKGNAELQKKRIENKIKELQEELKKFDTK